MIATGPMIREWNENGGSFTPSETVANASAAARIASGLTPYPVVMVGPTPATAVAYAWDGMGYVRIPAGFASDIVAEANPGSAGDVATVRILGTKIPIRYNRYWAPLESSGGFRKRVILGVGGQSNSQGNLKYWIAGSLPENAWSSVAAFSDPLPGTIPNRPTASVWPAVAAILGHLGVRVEGIKNLAVGGSSARHHWTGELWNFNIWQANTLVYGKRTATSAGDAGDKGNFLVKSGKLFQCTIGTLRYATINDPTTPTVINGQSYNYLDYMLYGPSVHTGSTEPNWASATNIGDAIVDSGATWKYVAVAPAVLTPPNVNSLYFDPLGLIARVVANMPSPASGATRIFHFATSAADTYADPTYYAGEVIRYSNAVTLMATYLQSLGIYVFLGNENAKSGETIMSNGKYPSQCAEDGATTAVAGMAGLGTVFRGVDWWAEWGATPPNYPESGTADSGTRVHLKMQALLRASRAVVDALMAPALLQ